VASVATLIEDVAMQISRVTSLDVINLVLGAILFISPWVAGFAHEPAAARNAWIFGVLIALASVGVLVSFAQWEEWLKLLFGLWVLISPWILGFYAAASPMWVHVVIGLVVAILTAVEITMVRGAPPAARA
jgi:hypothetical protein